MDPEVGNTSSIAFHSGFAANVYDISISAARVPIPATPQGTVGPKKYLFSPNADYQITFRCPYDGQALPLQDAEESVTLTIKTGTTHVFNGALIQADVSLPDGDGQKEIVGVIQASGANTGVEAA